MKYDVERAVVTLSVTELCAMALMGGDLDLRPGRTKRFSSERAAIGAKIHRKMQDEAHGRYDAEVSLCNTTLLRGLTYEVSGRADGILYGERLTVDEIKTVNGRVFDLPPAPMHSAQVRCYAYFLCRERGLDQIDTRLSYYRLEDGKTRYVTVTHRFEDLKSFYQGLLARIESRARLLVERQTVRIPSAASARFPYASVREGQDIMLRECYRDIKAGKRLFIEAPTGTGKTLSALYPAVRALGEEHCDKIFYLTAKAATRREAFRAAAQLFSSGAKLCTLILTAREQICQNEMARKDPTGISHHCNPMDCRLAQGFYDRVLDAICDAFSAQHGFTRSSVIEIANRHQICPYEFQLELSLFCEILICDYNYAFDPHVYLRRYFDPEPLASNQYVFLIDEAHNLGDRACAMYSAVLENSEVITLWRTLPETEVDLRDQLEDFAHRMHGLRRLCRESLQKDAEGMERGYYLSSSPISAISERVGKLRTALDAWLVAHRGDLYEREVQSLSKILKHFEVISEYYDENFLTFVEVEGDTRRLRLICLDPSRILEACLARAHASVLFSATLTPLDYFADILGGGRQAIRVSLPSPFDRENLCLVAVPTISTRYEDRDKSYRKIAAMIAATVSGKNGNYIAYFPSYQYMESVRKIFCERYPEAKTIVQTRHMSIGERESFLDAFCDDGCLRVGFCVLGGSFSEGVDLPGKRLIGSIVVGTGLPAISNERNILRDHYEVTRERGFDYAYTYPGMNRVLQAAGRVIRREDDRGVIVLIDDRYADERIKQLFPDHWQNIQYAGKPMELAEIVAEFWRKFENNG